MLGITTLAKKIEIGTHVKLQARALLESSHACARWRVAVPIFLARVVAPMVTCPAMSLRTPGMRAQRPAKRYDFKAQTKGRRERKRKGKEEEEKERGREGGKGDWK